MDDSFDNKPTILGWRPVDAQGPTASTCGVITADIIFDLAACGLRRGAARCWDCPNSFSC